tara:strand:+ start:390 stop:890 length:501 start_codon:yes stop_codon:yes gene_type:complete
MPDYSKAIIYTIRSGDGLYVGSTCAYAKRKYDHNRNIYNYKKRDHNTKLYKTIRENNGEWDMKPHKEFPCENKTQLTIEEERVRREMNADLNVYKCDNIVDMEKYKKEYYKDNIEKFKERRIRDKEKLKQYSTEIIECECGCKIKRGGKAKHRKTDKHIKLMCLKS